MYKRERKDTSTLKKYSHVENTSTGIVNKQIIGLKKIHPRTKIPKETNVRRSLVKKKSAPFLKTFGFVLGTGRPVHASRFLANSRPQTLTTSVVSQEQRLQALQTWL